MSTNSYEPSPSGLIEFDLGEPEAAAAPKPGGVDPKIDSDPLSINFGRDKSTQPAAAERMLAGATIDWLVAFAPELRPKTLCDRYPHVANRLARDWADVARSIQSLKELAADPRWGGTGYPVLAQTEVNRLLQKLGGT